MKRFLSLKPWRPEEAISVAVAIATGVGILLASGLSSGPGMVAGIAGALFMRHMALHRWTLLEGTIGQRVLLLVLWFVALSCGGLVATVLGF